MTEPSESADAVQHQTHQSTITEKTAEVEQSPSPNNYYTKACDETPNNQYVGNYYTTPCLQYPSANDTQWPIGDVNGYAYAPAAYIPYRGYDGYEWYAPEYSQEWSSLDATAQAYTPAGSYYYLDNYAAANGSADALVPDETELEQSFGQLTLDGYGTTYKGWNAVSPQQFLHLSTSKPTDYSHFHNKNKMSAWDVPKLDSVYRNNSSTRYWSVPKESFQKISDAPLEKNVQKYTSDQDSPDTSLYNQKEFDIDLSGARYFVIKSYSEDDIHRSIKYGIWCSTEYGNKRLDAAFREREGKGPIYLLFSVNGSGHFCGVAVMTSILDYSSSASVWAQNKWKGKFDVRWLYVKDVPNSQLRHIKLENNENKPVTNSRDTQEVPGDKGKQVLYIIHQYRHTTSIFDDFHHYEQRLLEESKSNPLG